MLVDNQLSSQSTSASEATYAGLHDLPRHLIQPVYIKAYLTNLTVRKKQTSCFVSLNKIGSRLPLTLRGVVFTMNTIYDMKVELDSTALPFHFWSLRDNKPTLSRVWT